MLSVNLLLCTSRSITKSRTISNRVHILSLKLFKYSKCNLSTNIEHKNLPIYKGEYEKKLRYLRRFSLFSSILSTFGLPIAMTFASGSIGISFIGQVLISSSVIFTSLSSTLFLHMLTSPYITNLIEISESPIDKVALPHRKFQANRINLFGNDITTEFSISAVKPIGTTFNYPFATFQANEKFYYLNVDKLEDLDLKEAFKPIE